MPLLSPPKVKTRWQELSEGERNQVAAVAFKDVADGNTRGRTKGLGRRAQHPPVQLLHLTALSLPGGESCMGDQEQGGCASRLGCAQPGCRGLRPTDAPAAGQCGREHPPGEHWGSGFLHIMQTSGKEVFAIIFLENMSLSWQ